MDFESLVKEIERAFMPELEQRALQLTLDSRFTDVHRGSMRHCERIHTVGLTCHPALLSSNEHYSISVNIFGNQSTLLRGFVTWSQTYVSVPVKDSDGNIVGYHNESGYTFREWMTKPFKLESGETLQDFLSTLPPLLKAFDRGIRRGRPPGKMRALWNQLAWGSK